jgi:hypothetical protein
MVTSVIEARDFADILRNPDDPQWQLAYKRLVGIMRRHLRGGRAWPRVREVAITPHPEVAYELADEFWMMLKDNPRMLRAAAVQGYGAITRQVCRFLRMPRSLSIETSESRLREHFASKLRGVLRYGHYRELCRNLWGISGLAERSADARDLERARCERPQLVAHWKAQRPGQDPPIVRHVALRVHLDATLHLAGAYCWFVDIHSMCWNALTPALSAVLPHIRVHNATTGDEIAVTDDPLRDFTLPIILQNYFDGLDFESQSVVRIAYREPCSSLRDIEMQTGIAKTTVNRKLERFRTGLRARLRANEYGIEDEHALVHCLRDILDS